MGNIPVPFTNVTPNSMPIASKRLLLAYVISMSACIVGSVVYAGSFEPYFDAQYFGMLAPAFLAGYLIIVPAEILVICSQTSNVFLEICLAAFGILGNGVCGVFQSYKWIQWIVDTFNDPDLDFGIQELLMALAFLTNTAAFITVIIVRYLEDREEMSGETPAETPAET